MKVLYLDCFAGISGDMFVGAMLDLGLELAILQRELRKLHIGGYRLEAQQVDKRGLRATQFKVLLQSGNDEHLADQIDDHPHSHPHRALTDILTLINNSELSAQVKQWANKIFTRLGEAEASVHGVPIEQVHFHEVGGVDAIVDIVGAAIAIDQLGIERIVASPLHLGSGMVKMSHGLYPIPAPATAKLLEGIPAYATEAKGELTTPTGAAIVTTLAHSFGPMPQITILKTGYGAGSKDRDFPNVLRAILCEQTDNQPATLELQNPQTLQTSNLPASNSKPANLQTPNSQTLYQTGQATVIEANIDDMNPQHYEPLLAHLLTAGALDVTLLPVQMKKQRPGTLLQVLAKPADLHSLLAIIFRESSTIGVRTYEVTRYMLPREIVTVTTSFGPVRVKLARLGEEIVNAMPEYEDCRALAEQTGVAIKIVTAAAQVAIAQRNI